MPKEERTLHMVTEAFSVGLMVPYYIYLANKASTALVDKWILRFFAIAGLIVDGYLWVKWNRQRKSEK